MNIEPTKRDIEVLDPVDALPRYADGKSDDAGPHPANNDAEDQEPPQIAAE